MKMGTALAAFTSAIPALAVCGVCTWWALTSSGWWLIGTIFSVGMMPSAKESVVTKDGRSVASAQVSL